MSQAAFLADLDAAMHAAFFDVGIADRATYRSGPAATAVPCTVTVDDGVQLLGEAVTTDQTVIRVLRAEVGTPRHGGVFAILGQGETVTSRWAIDRIESMDESAAVLVVRRVP